MSATAGLSSKQLARDYLLTSPDAHDIAYQWVDYERPKKKQVPSSADLAQMITGIGVDLTMQGAPELEIDILDVDWKLLRSGFFDPQQTGTLDKIEINYPQGSRYFWRLRQLSPQQGSRWLVQTYWWPRVVDDLDNLHGPFSVRRAKRTRAEFMRMCVEKIKGSYTPHFYSKQLTVKQPIANIKVASSASDTATSGAKGVGVSAKARKHLTVKGQKMTQAQADTASTLLRVADQLHAGKVATEALIYAAIWESDLSENATNGTYWGVLSAKTTNFTQHDTVGMATAFLQGNKSRGFQGGGAIYLASQGAAPVQIAQEVEGGGMYAGEAGYPGDTKAIAEVDRIIEYGGGASGSGGVAATNIEVVQNYNFQIGTSGDRHESFWTGMNRLAQEVKWELIVDGDDVYYDSDRTLVRDQIAEVVAPDDVALADWSYDWDKNLIVANFDVALECDPFQYRPADVFKLHDFGPASEARSSVGLPGRWLVGEIQRNAGDIVSTLTLVQPVAPLPEPAPQVREASTGAGGASVVGKASPGTVLAAVAAAQRLSNMHVPYLEVHYAGSNTWTSPAKLRANGLDCSSSSSWVLYQAGLLSSVSPMVSGQFETWGEAGPGQQLTIHCNSGHVFLEFKVPGIGHYAMDTAYPGADGPKWGPWTSTEQSFVDSGAFVARHPRGT